LAKKKKPAEALEKVISLLGLLKKIDISISPSHLIEAYLKGANAYLELMNKSIRDYNKVQRFVKACNSYLLKRYELCLAVYGPDFEETKESKKLMEETEVNFARFN